MTSTPSHAALRACVPLVLACAAVASVSGGSGARAAAASMSSAPAAPTTTAAPNAATPNGRVLVLGFDGADARTVSELMARGELPNCARLAAQGTFAPLATTTPNESPVAWSSLNSGQDPARTGIPGFVRRENGAQGPTGTTGFVAREDRAVADMHVAWIWRVLGGWPPALVAVACAAAVFVCFFAVFAFALRIRRGAALGLALALGAAGSWAGLRAARAVPRIVDDVIANPCRTGGFWEEAARAGVPCVVLEGAMAWDRAPIENLQILSGLGVPDVRGENCDWFVYTSDSTRSINQAPAYTKTSTGGFVFLFHEVNGHFESRVYGPTDLVAIGARLAERAAIRARIDAGSASDADHDRLDEIVRDLGVLRPAAGSEDGRLSVPLVVERTSGGAKVSIDGHAQELPVGGWSKWYTLEFELSALVRVRALTRARLVSLEPLELFVDTLQIDPGHAPFWQPVSQPPEFAAELAHGLGDGFETVGWACLTMPFKDARIDVRTFLEDIEFTQGWRTKLLDLALARDDWRVLVNVESTPDRVQHMLYQYYDPEHPKHDRATAAQTVTYFGRETKLSDVVPETYRQMDATIGRVLDQHVRPGDTLIVCADHGFQSFRRQVHLNNWLCQEGYLVLRDDVTTASKNLEFVDWTRTRAYAIGLGGIYLNLKGREAAGIVEPAERDALLAEITQKLLALEDRGARAVHDVVRTDAIHSGPHLDLEADLMPGFAAGWRVSWTTTGGGMALEPGPGVDDPARPKACFADNTSNWSGDHVSVASALVPGVFFCNRKVEIPAGGLDLLHIAPTVLALTGVPIPASYQKPPLRLVQ